jgi:DNA-binding HxlR family transcriptional regulator
MRGYNQRCGLAKALDVVGDRWTLLLIRELLIRDACRYTDLRLGLPGIATNLLADRLRELEAGGVVERFDAPPPVATTLFRLTPRGRALEPALLLLGQWGAPLLADADPAEPLQPHWLVLPLRMHLRDRGPDGPPMRLALRADGEAITVTLGGGAVDVALGECANPDARLSGSSDTLLKLLTGRIGLRAAGALGVVHQDGQYGLSRLCDP